MNPKSWRWRQSLIQLILTPYWHDWSSETSLNTLLLFICWPLITKLFILYTHSLSMVLIFPLVLFDSLCIVVILIVGSSGSSFRKSQNFISYGNFITEEKTIHFLLMAGFNTPIIVICGFPLWFLFVAVESCHWIYTFFTSWKHCSVLLLLKKPPSVLFLMLQCESCPSVKSYTQFCHFFTCMETFPLGMCLLQWR
jgi:hypothetical protein